MWYKKENPNETYYTPFTSAQITYSYIGTGEKKATPKEMVEYLSNPANKDCSIQYSGYVERYDKIKVKDSPQDLPGGAYIYKKSDMDFPERLTMFEIRRDAYIDVSNLNNEAKQDINDFLANENLYRENDMIYKIGFLLYGPPGTGKSSFVRELLHNNFPADTVTIFLYTLPSVDFIEKIKASLGNRLKVFVFEELATVTDIMPLHLLLNFLDGEHSVDKSITIATTNYPEKLPGNLVDRPSRFDKRYKLGSLNDEDRQKLFSFYLKRPLSAEELEATKGMSAASIKEISLLVKIKKMEIKAAVKRLKDYSELVKKDFGEYKKMGFRRDLDFE